MTLAEDATSSGGAVWELCPGTGKAGAILWADLSNAWPLGQKCRRLQL